jgi:hypothetical protein
VEDFWRGGSRVTTAHFNSLAAELGKLQQLSSLGAVPSDEAVDRLSGSFQPYLQLRLLGLPQAMSAVTSALLR